MKNILVATDGSKTSEKALLKAKELGEIRDSKIKIIHVTTKRPSIPSDISSEEVANIIDEAKEEWDEESKLVLDEAMKIFEDFTGEVNTVSRHGDPAEEIIKEAELESEEYDLVIMGNRGLGKFSRTLLGSVSNKVLNKVDKNVMIIK